MTPDGVIVIYNNITYKNVKLYRWYDFFGGMNRFFQIEATIIALKRVFKVIYRCFN